MGTNCCGWDGVERASSFRLLTALRHTRCERDTGISERSEGGRIGEVDEEALIDLLAMLRSSLT
jgi:hypothetical protein